MISRKQNVCVKKEVIALIAIGFLILIAPLGSSIISFYEGDVIEQRNTIKIEVAGETANIIGEHLLYNAGDSLNSLEITLPGYPAGTKIEINDVELKNPVSIRSKDTVKITAKSSVNVKDGSLNFFPTVKFDGKGANTQTNEYTVEVLFSETGTAIQSSSIKLDDKGVENNKKIFSFGASNVYPGLINIQWISQPPNLDVSRTNNNVLAKGDKLEVEVKIKNNGGNKIENIKLTDDLLTKNFANAQPSGEFRLIDDPTDPSFRWLKIIGSLNPGEEAVFRYNAEVTSTEGLKLNALKIYSGDKFIKSVEPKVLDSKSSDIPENGEEDINRGLNQGENRISEVNEGELIAGPGRIAEEGAQLTTKESENIGNFLKDKKEKSTISNIIIAGILGIIILVSFVLYKAYKKRGENE